MVRLVVVWVVVEKVVVVAMILMHVTQEVDRWVGR